MKTGIGIGIDTQRAAGSGSSFDPLAQPFLTAATIPNDSTVFYNGSAQQKTGAQISTIINDYAKDLKGIGPNNGTENLVALGDLMVLPFTGGTSVRHKLDMMYPTTSAKNVTFSGGITHNALGAKANGLNGAGLTAWLTSYHGLDQYTIALYFSVKKTEDNKSFGCEDAANNRFFLCSPEQTSSGIFYGYNDTDITYTKPGLGLLIVSRLGTTVKTKIGTSSIVTRTVAVGTNPDRAWDMFGRRDNSTVSQYNDPGYGDIVISSVGFTDNQINALAASIIAKNTSLVR